MADPVKTTMGVDSTTHKKLKALAALSGSHMNDALTELVDTALVDRGINPDTMRALDDRG